MGLGLVLALLSQVDHMTRIVSGWGIDREIAAYAILTVGFLGLRFTGQGALTLSCRTMLGRWFERNRGLASSIRALRECGFREFARSARGLGREQRMERCVAGNGDRRRDRNGELRLVLLS